MRAAVLLLWVSCLYTIFRTVLCLVLTASPLRRLLVLAVAATALAFRRSPEEMRRNHQ